MLLGGEPPSTRLLTEYYCSSIRLRALLTFRDMVWYYA
nr:MAG TPA: hypothetical protein [Bacteriophage sp.]